MVEYNYTDREEGNFTHGLFNFFQGRIRLIMDHTYRRAKVNINSSNAIFIWIILEFSGQLHKTAKIKEIGNVRSG